MSGSPQEKRTPRRRRILPASGAPAYSPITRPATPSSAQRGESSNSATFRRSRSPSRSSGIFGSVSPRRHVAEPREIGEETTLVGLDDTIVQSTPEHSSSESEEEMSNDITFSGKAVELEHLLTHATVVFLSKPSKFATGKTKCGFVAAKFRGKALDWLTSQLKQDDTKAASETKTLDSWVHFESLLKQTFLPSKDTQRQQADNSLRSLRQKGSAQQYALEFDKLMVTLDYPEDAHQVAFRAGLKPEVKKQLVGDDSSTYETLREVAIAYDEELYSLRTQTRRRGRTGPAKHNAPTDKH